MTASLPDVSTTIRFLFLFLPLLAFLVLLWVLVLLCCLWFRTRAVWAAEDAAEAGDPFFLFRWALLWRCWSSSLMSAFLAAASWILSIASGFGGCLLCICGFFLVPGPFAPGERCFASISDRSWAAMICRASAIMLSSPTEAADAEADAEAEAAVTGLGIVCFWLGGFMCCEFDRTHLWCFRVLVAPQIDPMAKIPGN